MFFKEIVRDMLIFRAYLLGLFLLPGFSLAQGPSPASVMPVGILPEASKLARTDAVGPGYCGRGLWSVLTNLGYSEGIRSANGQDWEEVLSGAGWIPWACPSPELAPYGSVLVYLSDVRVHGKNLVGTKGGTFGHAELVALDGRQRVYVSDAPRANAGGTVPDNFTRRAWVPPGFSFLGNVVVSPSGALITVDRLPDGRLSGLPSKPTGTLVRSLFDPVAARRNSDQLVADRLGMARAYFASPLATTR